MKKVFPHKHVLSMEAFGREDITHVLDTAESLIELNRRAKKKVPTLQGRTVINLFLEPSTRTRTSFEIAAKRFGADAINISGSTSSVVKGESLLDTIKTLNAMNPDILVIRHSASGAAQFATRYTKAPVINAGDGTHEHPTQAFLDALTIRQRKGGFENLQVTIAGDILHSRVARSNIIALTKLGAKVTVCAPPTMMPKGVEKLGVTALHSLDDAVKGADVVMMLRVQLERQSGPLFSTPREYARMYGLSPGRFKTAAPDAIVMHPGPMNRGMEISPEVADSGPSVILDQVENGVAVRMALMYLILQEAADAPG